MAIILIFFGACAALAGLFIQLVVGAVIALFGLIGSAIGCSVYAVGAFSFFKDIFVASANSPRGILTDEQFEETIEYNRKKGIISEQEYQEIMQDHQNDIKRREERRIEAEERKRYLEEEMIKSRERMKELDERLAQLREEQKQIINKNKQKRNKKQKK